MSLTTRKLSAICFSQLPRPTPAPACMVFPKEEHGVAFTESASSLHAAEPQIAPLPAQRPAPRMSQALVAPCVMLRWGTGTCGSPLPTWHEFGRGRRLWQEMESFVFNKGCRTTSYISPEELMSCNAPNTETKVFRCRLIVSWEAPHLGGASFLSPRVRHSSLASISQASSSTSHPSANQLSHR